MEPNIRFSLDLKKISDLVVILDISEQELRYVVSEISDHVQVVLIPKDDGTFRTTYKTSPLLKRILKTLNKRLLQKLYLPDTLHGAVQGKSPLTNATVHVGKNVVVCLDIKDFYPSIHHTRVYKLFIKLGCSPDVSRLLTRLTTFENHLAQGFPTSSSIANLVLREIEPRFTGLCEQQGIQMTFFQDDLTISGNYRAKELVRLLEKMLQQCGFETKLQKRKIMPSHESQQVTGVIVNQKPNVSRRYYRELRATLHRCKRDGVECQAKGDPKIFLRSLHGRIQWVRSVNLELGEKLLRQYKELEGVDNLSEHP